MPLELQEASQADLDTIVRTQFRAFHPQDELHCLIYPSPTTPTAGVYEQTIKRHIANWTTAKPPGSEVKWVKIVDAESGGEIIAAAKWIFFPTAAGESEEEKQEGGKRWSDAGFKISYLEPAIPEGGAEGVKGLVGMTGADDEAYINLVLNEVVRRRRERIQGPGALLDICFCDPAHHRRGAGKMLVQYGTRWADERGVMSYVEASYPGRRLYESCGFVMKENVVMDPAGFRADWKERPTIKYYWMDREIGGPKE